MVRVIDGVHLRAFPGQVTALLGANGAGKTTLMRAIAGARKPSRGEIEVAEVLRYNSIEFTLDPGSGASCSTAATTIWSRVPKWWS